MIIAGVFYFIGFLGVLMFLIGMIVRVKNNKKIIGIGSFLVFMISVLFIFSGIGAATDIKSDNEEKVIAIQKQNSEADTNKKEEEQKKQKLLELEKYITISIEAQDTIDGKQKVVVWMHNSYNQNFSGDLKVTIFDDEGHDIGGDTIYAENLKPGKNQGWAIIWAKPGISKYSFSILEGEFHK